MIKDKLGDFKKRVLKGEALLTNFLDFEEQKEIYALEQKGVNVKLFGGYEDAERKRAYIDYSSDEIDNKDFDIVIMQSTFDKKYANIGHRNVLGTIMSLGIERNTFGDIVVEDNLITIFTGREMCNYLMKNLTQIMNQPMQWHLIDSFKKSNETDEIKTINVASMRLDAVLARCINVGRSEATEIISNGYVMINHLECLNITHNVKEKDILSVRKYGRIEILEIVGLSKKNRTILKIRVKH